MYSSILFAIDDDEALPAAVPVVAAYARASGATVRVVHVHRHDPGAMNGADRRLVKSVTDRLAEEGIPAEGEVRLLAHEERIGRAVARAAIQARADLVMVGSHGRSDLAALLAGSVSNDVAAGLDVPVLVLHAAPVTAARPRTILVAVDGSPGSDQAVLESAEIASAFAAEVVVVHAQLVLATQGGAVVEPEEDARAAVRGAMVVLESRGVRATAYAPPARSVASAVVETAERVGADLVVLGSRRPTGLGGLLLGSVAHEAIHRLPCPVLLARRAAAGEPVA